MHVWLCTSLHVPMPVCSHPRPPHTHALRCFPAGCLTLAAHHLMPGISPADGSLIAAAQVPEALLWRYTVQLAGALRSVHAAGLALRPACLHPTKASGSLPARAILLAFLCCMPAPHKGKDKSFPTGYRG